MKRIEEYISNMFQHVDGDKAEIEALKAEMRTHLLEAVLELKAEGLSENAAIEAALKRFGEEEQLTGALADTFKAQKIKKRLFWAALAVSLIGLATLVGFYFRDRPYAETFTLMEQLVDTYRQKTDFTAEDKQELQSLLAREADLFENICFLVLYRIPQELQGKTTYDHIYEYEKVFVYGKPPIHTPTHALIGEELARQLPIYEYGKSHQVGKQWYLEWGFIKYNYRQLHFLPYSLLIMAVLFFTAGAVMHGMQHNWFQAHRVAKGLLFTSLAFLLAGLALGVGFYLRDQAHYEIGKLTEQLVDTYDQKEVLTEEDIKELQALPQTKPGLFDHLNYLAVYRLSKQVEDAWCEEMEDVSPLRLVLVRNNLTLIFDDLVFVYGENNPSEAVYSHHGDRLCVEWQFKNNNYYKYSFIPYICLAAFLVLLIAWRGAVVLSRKHGVF